MNVDMMEIDFVHKHSFKSTKSVKSTSDLRKLTVAEKNGSTTKDTTGKVYPASNQPWPTIEEVRNHRDTSATEN